MLAEAQIISELRTINKSHQPPSARITFCRLGQAGISHSGARDICEAASYYSLRIQLTNDKWESLCVSSYSHSPNQSYLTSYPWNEVSANNVHCTQRARKMLHWIPYALGISSEETSVRQCCNAALAIATSFTVCSPLNSSSLPYPPTHAFIAIIENHRAVSGLPGSD